MRRSKINQIPITLSESDGIRCLHFGSPWVQGAMRISRPELLVLEYVRRMMGWLLFLEPPERILQLGLGAGSLTRFSLARLPDSRVTVVEVGAEVIETAHDWFALPREEARLTIVHADAGDFLGRAAEHKRYGVVQVDLYDMHARGPVLDSLGFYRACRKALADPGICVINLFGEHDTFAPNLDRISRAFDGRMFALPATEEGNRIVFAFNGPMLSVHWQALREREAVLQRDYQLRSELCIRDIRRAFGDAGVFSI